MENELILRPQEENRLAVLRTSPKNYCKALCPKKVEDVFQSDEPSIGTIIRKFGEPQARAVLVILIADALEFFNVSNTMSATQVATTVDLIIEEYPYMKTDDFKLCFKNAMKMKYGENYNRIDGSIIMGWLREYNKERCAVADNQSWNTHKAKLSGETSFTSGLSYEEYRNELKLRVEQGDEEAAGGLQERDSGQHRHHPLRHDGGDSRPAGRAGPGAAVSLSAQRKSRFSLRDFLFSRFPLYKRYNSMYNLQAVFNERRIETG